jgi:hypothetical protein
MLRLVDLHRGSSRKQFCHKTLAPYVHARIPVRGRYSLALLSRAQHGERMVYYEARISLRNHVSCSQISRAATDKIRFGSAGAFGLALPFVVERLLHSYGYATTVRAFAIGIVRPLSLLLLPR